MNENYSIEKPLITVVTVTYNSSAYVRDAIESVLANAYQNFEYLISDDCSSDHTWDIIREYKDPRIKAWRNEPNLGEYNNRNKCIQRATGEFIFFVDGDDILLYRGLEDAVREISRFPDCGFGVVRPGSPKFIGPVELKREDAINLEFFGGGVLDSSVTNNVYRTSFIKRNLFLTQYKAADTFTRINFLKKTNVLVLYSNVSIWRQSPTQASRKISHQQLHGEILDFFKHYVFDDPDFLTKDQKEKLKPYYYRVLFKYLIGSVKDRPRANKFKDFFMDPFWKAIKYTRKPMDHSFWDHYTYNNINLNVEPNVRKAMRSGNTPVTIPGKTIL